MHPVDPLVKVHQGIRARRLVEAFYTVAKKQKEQTRTRNNFHIYHQEACKVRRMAQPNGGHYVVYKKNNVEPRTLK